MHRRGFLLHITQRPAQLLVLSFGVTIMLGAVLLSLPLAARGQQAASIIDALFTSTSAVCVTGLIVKDTPVYFSGFGLGVILMLIQAGGLGIMTISSAVALALKRGMALKQRMVMQQVMDQTYYEELKAMLMRILQGTLVIEAIGAAVLAAAWYESHTGFTHALWLGIFHSVSAFCNAGFSLFSDSLMRFQDEPVVLVTHTILIVTGGLGFTIVGPLMGFRLPHGLHARLTLIVTGVLILVGFVFFLLVESGRGMIDLSLNIKVWNALFQSVTARTAGFNTVDLTTWSNASIVMLFVLMFIGASPGSTGGGIKTTTLGVLLLSTTSLIRGRDEVEYHGRRIPPEVIIKAITVMLLALALIYLFIILLTLTEEAPFRSILFEVASAFGTVGLSLGMTPQLTAMGKIFITILMFLGRIGPLTVAMLVGERMKKARYQYPTERVMVG